MYTGAEKHFRDSVHGYIQIPLIIVEKIIDTPLFQRLQDVEQTGMRPLFPSARHNRFSHSLGVYFLGKQAIEAFRANSEQKVIGDGHVLGLVESAGHPDKVPSDDNEKTRLSGYWWDKHVLLFTLACLLHDCAHAPFSHTYEYYYAIAQKDIDEEYLVELFGEDCRKCWKGLIGERISVLDANLMKEYPSEQFIKDFGLFRKTEESIWVNGKNSVCRAKEHERLSATMVGHIYKSEILGIEEELLPHNPLVSEENLEKDLEFIARCILGLPYSSLNCSNAVEQSLKNCMIALLNSDKPDVDGLDYIVRDAHNSGIDIGRVDYHRLFRSLGIAHVCVIDNAEVRNCSIDGIWLEGSSFFSGYSSKTPSLKVAGKMRLEYAKFDESGRERPELDSFFAVDWFSVRDKTGNLKSVESNSLNVYTTSDGNDELATGDDKLCPDFKITCDGSVRVRGTFSGIVAGKAILNNDSSTLKAFDEYILVYDMSCLSALEHAMMARNYEYEWIYSHPQVLYRSSFLLCYMLRLSARFLCCKNHKEVSHFGTERLNLKSCENCKFANTDEPDFQIPRLLGFESYFSDEPELFFEEEGYLFYRSNDSDLQVLFKQIMLENERLGDKKSQEIACYFKRFFSRKHQRPLWKSRDEYQGIIREFSSTEKRSIFRKLTESEKSSQIAYKFLPSVLNEECEQYDLGSVVAVCSKLNTKRINAENTLMHSTRFGITRLCDIAQEESAPTSNQDFFYLYSDRAPGSSLSLDEVRSLLRAVCETNNIA